LADTLGAQAAAIKRAVAVSNLVENLVMGAVSYALAFLMT